MKFYKTTGFIYKIQNYADADKLVWILTKNNGKVNSIAKGVKKVTSKRAGHIDILNYNQFSFHKGRNLDTLTETKIINSFNDLKKEFVYDFFYIAELLHKITLDNDEAAKLCEILLVFLNSATKDTFKKQLLSFELQLLKLLGFEPNLRTFLDTDKHFEENDKIYISLTTPGFMSHGEPHSQVSPRLIKTQRFCLSQPIDSTITLTIEPELQKRINLIHKQWIQNVLDTRLKSLELMGDR